MGAFNPNSTATKGEEWPPVVASGVTLDTLTKAVSMSLIQSAGAVIANERIAVGTIPVRGGVYAVEVYDNENAVPAGAPSFLPTAAPNSDISVGPWLTQAGSGSNLYATMNDASSATYIKCLPPSPGAGGATYRGHINAASLGSLTGKRIASVSLGIDACGRDTGPNYSGTCGLTLGGVDVPTGAVSGGYGGGGNHCETSAFPLYYNPVTNKPWTIADLTALTSTAGNGFYINIASDGAGGEVRVYEATLYVFAHDETRLAFGSLDDSASALTASAWNDAAVLTPTGGAWTKDSSGSHLYLIRRISSSGALTIPTLAAAAAPTSVGEGFLPTLDPTYGYATAMGAAIPALFGLIQRTNGPANSPDSQPYNALVEGKVYSGQTARQEFSNAAATAYGIVSAYVKPNSASGDLAIKVKKVSDNSQLGTTVLFTAAEVALLPDAGGGWKLLRRQMDPTPATLAGSTQYYVEFSDATSGDDGTGALYWSVLTLDVGAQGADVGFGGTTDAATINGARATRYDLAATVATVPVAPASFAVAIAAQALAVPTDAMGCEITAINYAQITWAATALGGSFGEYEIERSDDGGTTWSPIFYVLAEALTALADYELLRNTSTLYRVRVVRSDGATSSWTTLGAGVTAASQRCEAVFVSNVVPTKNVAYDYPPQLEYQFPGAADLVLAPIYGRNRYVSMRPSEDRGVKFSAPLIVNNGATPLANGAAAYSALRSLAEDPTIPYVCVLTSEGIRYYASIAVPTGNTNRPVQVQIAQVQIAEVETSPVPVTLTLV